MDLREKVARKLLAISNEYVEWDSRPEDEKQRWLVDAAAILALFEEERQELRDCIVKAEEERDEWRAWSRKVDDERKAAEARCAKLEEERDSMARWIVDEAAQHERKCRPFQVTWDAACAECGGSMIVAGYRCAVHTARVALAGVGKDDVAFPCCGGVDAHRVSCHRAGVKEDAT